MRIWVRSLVGVLVFFGPSAWCVGTAESETPVTRQNKPISLPSAKVLAERLDTMAKRHDSLEGFGAAVVREAAGRAAEAVRRGSSVDPLVIDLRIRFRPVLPPVLPPGPPPVLPPSVPPVPGPESIDVCWETCFAPNFRDCYINCSAPSVDLPDTDLEPEPQAPQLRDCVLIRDTMWKCELYTPYYFTTSKVVPVPRK